MTTADKLVEILVEEIDRLKGELATWKRMALKESELAVMHKSPTETKKFSDSVPAYKISGINFPNEKEEERAPF